MLVVVVLSAPRRRASPRMTPVPLQALGLDVRTPPPAAHHPGHAADATSPTPTPPPAAAARSIRWADDGLSWIGETGGGRELRWPRTPFRTAGRSAQRVARGRAGCGRGGGDPGERRDGLGGREQPDTGRPDGRRIWRSMFVSAYVGCRCEHLVAPASESAWAGCCWGWVSVQRGLRASNNVRPGQARHAPALLPRMHPASHATAAAQETVSQPPPTANRD